MFIIVLGVLFLNLMISNSFPRRKPLRKWGFVVLGIAITLIIIALWYWSRVNENQWMFLPKLGIKLPLKYDIHGIDVSHHNGQIDWQKVRKMTFEDKKLQFVYIKATEGISLVDKYFDKNWQEADTKGLYRGAYHFYIPWKDPEPQVANFIKQVKIKKGDLPPVLDFEVGTNRFSRTKIIENLAYWLKAIEDHYGVKPMIYTNADFYKRYIKDNLDDYPLWIADYSNLKLDRYGDANILLWQHSKAGYVEGIRGGVDYNVFLGDAAALKKMALD
jgi:lysozyme